MTQEKDQAQLEAEELLPCQRPDDPCQDDEPDFRKCHECFRRPAVAAKLRELYGEIQKVIQLGVNFCFQQVPTFSVGQVITHAKYLQKERANYMFEVCQLHAENERLRNALNSLGTEPADRRIEHLRAENERLKAQAASWEETAEQHCRNKFFYRDLLDQVAKHLGPEVFVSDDGSIQDEPLRLKIPKLVEKLKAEKLAEDERVTERDCAALCRLCEKKIAYSGTNHIFRGSFWECEALAIRAAQRRERGE